MRKALVGLILAASALSPVAALAQEDEQGRPIMRRSERAGDIQPGWRAEARAERQAARAEQRAERQQSHDPEPARAQAQANAQADFEARAARRQARIDAQQQAQGDFEARAARRQAQVDAQAEAQAQAGFGGPRRDRDGRWQGRPGSVYPDAWQGNPNSSDLRRYQRRELENQRRFGAAEQRSQTRDWRGDRRDDHGDLHRDYRREHRDLHRSDPTRREHRTWHRDAARDHRQIHRDEHRDLHASGPTRREHRRWHRQWDAGWRGDRRYDWASWRFRNRSLFRLGSYYSPYRNHRYSRFSIGFYLDPGFYGRNYWVNDPWYYRLPPAPPGTQWIRYYDDVLLVDIYSGYVIDVIYDFFW
ncbi:MAG: RcnB family protein [Sphingosinicella sp.]